MIYKTKKVVKYWENSIGIPSDELVHRELIKKMIDKIDYETLCELFHLEKTEEKVEYATITTYTVLTDIT